MKTGIWVLGVLLLLMSSSCSFLTNADVYIINNSDSQVKVSVKKTEAIPKQHVTMEAGADYNFIVGTGNIGTFTFVHTAPISAKVKIADGHQVILTHQLYGIFGYDPDNIGQPGNAMFGPI